MKVSIWDFVLCGSFITSIILADLALVYFLLVPLTAGLGAYGAIVDVAAFLTLYGLLSALVVRLLLRLRPIQVGEFSMDHPNFTYWKLLRMLCEFGQRALVLIHHVNTVPFLVWLFGAQVGKNVAIGGTIDSPFLVRIGDGAVLGHGTMVSGDVIQGGKIVIGLVQIGAGATVGTNSVVFPQVEIGEGASLAVGSVVTVGSVIPPRESWKGNPARKWM